MVPPDTIEVWVLFDHSHALVVPSCCHILGIRAGFCSEGLVVSTVTAENENRAGQGRFLRVGRRHAQSLSQCTQP